MSKSKLSLDSTLPLPSGHSIPIVGFGVYQARGKECEDAVKEAVKVGYKHVDSAQAYRNEDLVSKSIPDRSKIFLTTKYMPTHQIQPSSQILKALRKSVPKLNDGKDENEGGYIDLMLIHAPWGGEEGRAKGWEALVKAQEEGWIRDIGVSNFGVRHLTQLPAPKPAINQIEVHPWCQQREIIEYCNQHGILVEAYCPLVQGDKRRLGDKTVVGIAEKYGKDAGQVLIRWSLQKGLIPLPKSVTPSRILSNANIFDFALDESDMAALDKLDMGADGAVSWNPVDAP